MTEPHLNFARRPFRDDRAVYLLAAAGLLAAVALMAANVRLYAEFQRQIAGTSSQIDYLEQRRARAAQASESARAALNSYKVSNLARESEGLLKVVAERRFSWMRLLATLERVLPSDVRVARMTPSVSTLGETFVALNLVGKGPESVVHTIAALSRDPEFSRVDLRGETSPEQGPPEGYSFELSVAYRAKGTR